MSDEPKEKSEEAKPATQFSNTDWNIIRNYFNKNPSQLMLHEGIRIFAARRRAESAQVREKWSEPNDNLVSFTIPYNEQKMDFFLESRVGRLLRPLSIIDPVFESASELKVLSIGPRNENEILHLVGHGFQLSNIDAVDLISNSPLVKIADMHDLPFEDDQYDVVVSGWTLPYSRNPKQALAEKIRVTKPGGLVCVGLTRVPPGDDGAQQLADEGAKNYLSTDEILEDMGSAATSVAFRHDPLDPSKKGGILLIVRVKE
jgi:SAM-dependent methyltransferase